VGVRSGREGEPEGDFRLAIFFDCFGLAVIFVCFGLSFFLINLHRRDHFQNA